MPTPFPSGPTHPQGVPESAADDAIGWMMATLAEGNLLSMGHRGASEVPGIPEHSQRAYDFSVQRGYPLLEISTNQTADGHWICSHDPDLNRTSETTGLPPLSQMSLREVQRLKNTRNCHGEPADYEVLDDLLARYAPTHIIAVDPKSSWLQAASLLDLCDSHGGARRIMGKWVGSDVETSRSLTEAFHERGYIIGGYWYAREYVAGDIQKVESMFDLSGMDWSHAVEVWDYLRGLDKPIIGHVLINEESTATAIAKGAQILQTARPDLCQPRSWWT